MPKGIYKHPPQCGFQKGHKPTHGFQKGNSYSKGQIPWNKGKHIYLGGGFKKGHIPWSKGKHLISWNKGKKMSEEQKLKISKSHIGKIGKDSSNWQGGITPLAKMIRYSIEYREWIQRVFIRDNYTCQDCKIRGGELHAHHIKSFSGIFEGFLELYDQFSPIEDKETLVRLAIKYKAFWDIANGMTLCRQCHKKTDSYAKK